ncbi:hypothetical protein D3C71_2207830 [compost metagenome]
MSDDKILIFGEAKVICAAAMTVKPLTICLAFSAESRQIRKKRCRRSEAALCGTNGS